LQHLRLLQQHQPTTSTTPPLRQVARLQSKNRTNPLSLGTAVCSVLNKGILNTARNRCRMLNRIKSPCQLLSITLMSHFRKAWHSTMFCLPTFLSLPYPTSMCSYK